MRLHTLHLLGIPFVQAPPELEELKVSRPPANIAKRPANLSPVNDQKRRIPFPKGSHYALRDDRLMLEKFQQPLQGQERNVHSRFPVLVKNRVEPVVVI